MTATTGERCSRCFARFEGTPCLMAGRVYCCSSCSVGSACEHQGIRREVAVRRFDGGFDRFRAVVKDAGPYEGDRRQAGDAHG